jgi:hypothetical protein
LGKVVVEITQNGKGVEVDITCDDLTEEQIILASHALHKLVTEQCMRVEGA